MGLFRLFLAISVIAAHSGTPVFGLDGVGPFPAVNLFFIISGFYMAMILTEKYTKPVPVDYYKNRLLRLMPTFYIGMILGIVVAWRPLLDYFHQLTLGGKGIMVFQHLFLIPQDLTYILCIPTNAGTCAVPNSMSANPPSWTLAVEIGFYVVAPLLVRSIKTAYLFVLAGVVYLGAVLFVTFPVTQLPFLSTGVDATPLNYNFYPSSFVFFGLGAIAYHLSKPQAKMNYLGLVVLVPLLALTDTFIPFWEVILAAAAVPVLFRLTKSNRIDRVIGELSYPVYVLHWPLLTLALTIQAAHPAMTSVVSIGTWVALGAIAGGLIIHYSLERWIGLTRSRISRNAAESAIVQPDAIVDRPTSRGLPALRTWLAIYLGAPLVLVVMILVAQAA